MTDDAEMARLRDIAREAADRATELQKEVLQLRKKFREAEALLLAGRHAFNDLNPNGKTIIDFYNVWLDHAHDRRRKVESTLEKLTTTARLLHQNAEGCAVNHYGEAFNIHGPPGWLADAEADIVAAQAVLKGNKP